MEKYTDRVQAGQLLATQLQHYAKQANTLVLALPRGGVPVAYEVAKQLKLPLDIFIVRKLGVPGHEELAMGAIASGGAAVFNQAIIKELNISQTAIDRVMAKEKIEIMRREKTYRGTRTFPDLINKTIILVDDGIATGATIRAAIKALRMQKVKSIIIAVPVAALDTCRDIILLVDELICPLKPENFYAVGVWYKNFEQIMDLEVSTLLNKSFDW